MKPQKASETFKNQYNAYDQRDGNIVFVEDVLMKIRRSGYVHYGEHGKDAAYEKHDERG